MPGDASIVVAWAASVPPNGYLPGLEATEYTDSSRALGPASGPATDVVVLGRGGSIALEFAEPFANGPGADFAVWENGLEGSGRMFAELGYVEVSSDGTAWVRFPVSTRRSEPVETYGWVDPADYAGFAGVHPIGTGTAFDLDVLKSLGPVSDGRVDLNHVRFVRIVDVVGDGSQRDQSGLPIYDPYPTTGTAGFDLDAIGVLSQ